MDFLPSLKAFLYGSVGLLFLSPAAAAAEVVLTELAQEYSGNPIAPAVATVPAGLPVSLLYQNLSNPGVPALETVFDNTPAVLPLSYSSISFAAHRINGLGNYVTLAGGARRLKSCEITLVNWARAAQFPTIAAANPAGYIHPVTAAVFAVTPDEQLVFLTDVTRNVLIPWRPDFLPNGQPYPFNGTAFRASFDFPEVINLPERILISVEYNTSVAGFVPIGVPGPYDQLNVVVDGAAASIGADVDPDVVLRVTPTAWNYPNTGWSGMNGPPVRLRAGTEATKTQPVVPGTYQITALAGAGGTEGTASATLTISPASFAAWQAREFTPAQQLGGEAAAGADPDRDGFTNFAEFAMGTGPRSAAEAPPLLIPPGGRSITLTRPRYLGGVSYISEESSDLASWNPLPWQIISTSPATETIRAEASAAAQAGRRSFMRFRFAPP